MANAHDPPSDARLLRRAVSDPDAFRALYDRYAERVFGYFMRRTRDRDAAFDLSAETFSQVWAIRARFRDEADGSAAPWIFGIARNVLLMSVRRGALERRTMTRLGVMERLDSPYHAASALPEPAWGDGVDELLDTLPTSQSEAIRLRVLEQLDYDEVADDLGTTKQAARVRVHRGLAALRSHVSASKDPS